MGMNTTVVIRFFRCCTRLPVLAPCTGTQFTRAAPLCLFHRDAPEISSGFLEFSEWICEWLAMIDKAKAKDSFTSSHNLIHHCFPYSLHNSRVVFLNDVGAVAESLSPDASCTKSKRQPRLDFRVADHDASRLPSRY